jgi:hypothetical protein
MSTRDTTLEYMRSGKKLIIVSRSPDGKSTKIIADTVPPKEQEQSPSSDKRQDQS